MHFDFNGLFDKGKESKEQIKTDIEPEEKMEEKESKVDILLSKKQPFIPTNVSRYPTIDLKDKQSRNKLIEVIMEKGKTFEDSDLDCILFSNCIFLGQTERNKPSGFGLSLFDNFDFYLGGFSNGKFEGVGFYHKRNGDFYFSEFKQGLCHGKVFYTKGINSYTKAEAVNGVLTKAKVNDTKNVISEINFKKNPNNKSSISQNKQNKNIKSKILNEEDEVEITKINKQYVRKKVDEIENPKDIQKYLKQFCLIAKEAEFKKINDEIFMEEGNNILHFEKKIKQRMNSIFAKSTLNQSELIATDNLFMGVEGIGTMFLPDARIYHSLFKEQIIDRFCYSFNSNGEYDMGFLDADQSRSGEPLFSGFGIRFYRENKYLVCGFIYENKLNGYYLLEHESGEQYKFCYFQNNELKKELFGVNSQFDWKRLFSNLSPYLIANLSKSCQNNKIGKIKTDFIEKEKIKMKKMKTQKEMYENIIIVYFMESFCKISIDPKQMNKKSTGDYKQLGIELLEALTIKKNIRTIESRMKTSKSMPIHSEVAKGQRYKEIKKRPLKKSVNTPTQKNRSKAQPSQLFYTSKFMEKNDSSFNYNYISKDLVPSTFIKEKSKTQELTPLSHYMQNTTCSNTIKDYKDYNKRYKKNTLALDNLKSKGFLPDEEEDDLTESQFNFVEISEHNSNVDETFDITIGKFYPTNYSKEDNKKDTLQQEKLDSANFIKKTFKPITKTKPASPSLDSSPDKQDNLENNSMVTKDELNTFLTNKLFNTNNFKIKQVSNIENLFTLIRNNKDIKETEEVDKEEEEKEKYMKEFGIDKINNIYIYNGNSDKFLRNQGSQTIAGMLNRRFSIKEIKEIYRRRSKKSKKYSKDIPKPPRVIRMNVNYLKTFNKNKPDYPVQDLKAILYNESTRSPKTIGVEQFKGTFKRKSFTQARQSFDITRQNLKRKLSGLKDYVKGVNSPRKSTVGDRSISFGLNEMSLISKKDKSNIKIGKSEGKILQKKRENKKRKSKIIPIISQQITQPRTNTIPTQTSKKLMDRLSDGTDGSGLGIDQFDSVTETKIEVKQTTKTSIDFGNEEDLHVRQFKDASQENRQ